MGMTEQFSSVLRMVRIILILIMDFVVRDFKRVINGVDNWDKSI